jgi:hypothetical protein
MDGRTLDTAEIARLRTARKAVTTTCLLLDFGRGNVDADITHTGRESRYRTAAAKGLISQWDAENLRVTNDLVANYEARRAGAAIAFQAGNCREHASVAALAYGRFAVQQGRDPSETVDVVGGLNHNWAEVRAHPGGEDSVVMDPWAEGPPVMAADSRFARDRSRVQTGPGVHIGPAFRGYMAARSTASVYRNEQQSDLQSRLAKQRRLRRNEDLTDPARGIWSQQNVLDDEFAQRALGKLKGERESLQRQGEDHPDTSSLRQKFHEVTVEIKAAGIAREFGGGGVANLNSDASGIVDVASSLLFNNAG